VPFTLRGAEAFVSWGYYRAATLRDWEVTRTGSGAFALEARLIDRHPTRLEQRPLVFVVPTQQGAWTWPIVGPLHITGASCTATLGPKERTP
jgi:hypothetical protein